ncbi:MAG: hypothetical protein KKI09_06360 [Spirochaetes bacterium]|nr:hypothetical protein [Spirochaetota bacterium]MBU0955034.1 hypothetical protein [Spirochaetota bacterium]
MNGSLPFSWTAGAIWLLPDGTVIKIPGFHDEWIQANQELVPGCTNVCDVVIRKSWLSIVTYSEKYVEIMLPGREPAEFMERMLHYLGLNLQHWDNALVMTMEEEGYFKIENRDFEQLAALRQRLLCSPPPDSGQ